MHDRLSELEERYEELTRQMASPEHASDPSALATLGRELSRLEPLVATIRAVRQLRAERDATAEMATDPDEEVRAMAHEELARLNERGEALEQELRRLLVPRDPNDDRSVIIEVRAGTGGEEASLFAADLFRMYARYAERQGWPIELLAVSESDSGGYKEAIAEVTADGAYSRLKYESGVHRVQRVPVTESSGRIHTSTATVAVLPEAEEVEIDLPEKDLRIDVKRSSGPGGQSVNTTDSAVRVTHLPTGLVVDIQDEKSQHKNKAKALAILRARLLELERQRQAEERGDQRRSQVGSGERSEKIRTYNFPDDRVTDHRIGLTVHNLPGLLAGDLDRLIEPLVEHDQAERMARVGAVGGGERTDGERS
ncbi:MAG: peptide chain release factor 1 [Chloroflexi bacterium]|nr:MAG: peptide chain release factor 1 [Chloroflexota bacterium]